MKNKSFLLYVFFLIFFTTLVTLRVLPFAYDDAYIHFRIAENFANHGEPFFNPGDPVMATSSFVWTTILALLSLTRLNLLVLVCVLNSILTVIGSLLWAHLLKKASGSDMTESMIGLFRIIYIGTMLPSSAGLMETPLAMALVAWAFLLLSNDKWQAGILLSVCIFTRLELVTLFPFMVVSLPVRDRRHILNFISAFLISVAVISLPVLLFYSTLIPQTVTAKQIVYALSRESVFQDVLYSLVPQAHYPIGNQFGWRIPGFLSSYYSWAWLPGLFFLLGLICCRLPWKSMFLNPKTRWVPGIFTTGIAIAGAYVIKHVFLHPWYKPLFCIPVIFFFFTFYRSSRLMKFAVFLLILLPFGTVLEFSLGASGKYHFLQYAVPGARVQRYLEVGGLLHRLYPGTRLMTSEIGGLGYSFKGKILDGAGLVSPGALDYHPLGGSTSGIGGIPEQFIREEKPELIVSYPVFLRNVNRSYLIKNYVKIGIPVFSEKFAEKIHRKTIWGCSRLLIFIRRDIAAREPEKLTILKTDLK